MDIYSVNYTEKGVLVQQIKT